MIFVLILAAVFVAVALGLSQFAPASAGGPCPSPSGSSPCPCPPAPACGQPPAPSGPVAHFAGAIAFAEGYWDRAGNVLTGNRPARDNNPGDLTGTGDAGAEGIYRVYSTAQLGWQGLYNELMLIVNNQSRYYKLTMTIAQMAAKWTTTQQSEWSASVASYLGANVTDTLAEWLT